ncbi:MAG: 2,3-bisphosphoglycerate-independent phosphoglycerate mutase [Candidatus Woesebacteria bacterium GW2011_GWA1_37_8]|nr:MAG: 2,3-bisphosphoglycerate-independent phosphoglycerate mutase [Candidatus Woesebacteria bacterium GW2011_GWA1_37_8]
MTEYHKGLPVSGVAFMPEEVNSGFAEIISRSGLLQAHLAESEKERFIKYYFNGMKEEPFQNEEDFIVASPKVPTYDLKPEMSLPSLVKTFSRVLNSDKYNFIVLNFANPDMVAHTGNLKATIKAVEVVDKYLNILVSEVLNADGTVFVTADHGNAEELVTYPTDTFFFTTSRGTVNTDHSNNPVPLLVINNSLYKKPIILPKGSLADVATTILSYMNLKIPGEMSGKNLFQINNSMEGVSAEQKGGV